MWSVALIFFFSVRTALNSGGHAYTWFSFVSMISYGIPSIISFVSYYPFNNKVQAFLWITQVYFRVSLPFLMAVVRSVFFQVPPVMMQVSPVEEQAQSRYYESTSHIRNTAHTSRDGHHQLQRDDRTGLVWALNDDLPQDD
eukprot:TRINITY_DN12059_c0_g1_i1.p1 TRINITY_DN12059_c0_g1~~TRINITY_DN12059_c0_g1_i1.p1  ORF type:complete len:141 (-),score=15.26 TRINITY_DN12059_c0_g1_i1:160-582(-)